MNLPVPGLQTQQKACRSAKLLDETRYCGGKREGTGKNGQVFARIRDCLIRRNPKNQSQRVSIHGCMSRRGKPTGRIRHRARPATTGLLAAESKRRLDLPSSELAPASRCRPSFHSGPYTPRHREPLMSTAMLPAHARYAPFSAPRCCNVSLAKRQCHQPIEDPASHLVGRKRNGNGT